MRRGPRERLDQLRAPRRYDSPAPLCGDCGPVFERHGSPAFWDEQRPALAEAVTGAPTMMGESPPDGLVAYAEHRPETDGTRWGHLPGEAVEAYRWAVWGRFGGRYAPAEYRSEAVARAGAREAAKRDANAAVKAEEASRADVYRFGVPR